MLLQQRLHQDASHFSGPQHGNPTPGKIRLHSCSLLRTCVEVRKPPAKADTHVCSCRVKSEDTTLYLRSEFTRTPKNHVTTKGTKVHEGSSDDFLRVPSCP